MLEEKNDSLHQADGSPENLIPVEGILENAKSTDVPKEVLRVESHKVIEEIDNSNAEESEDEMLSERHQIPMIDYEAMSKEDLVTELEKLLETGKVSSIREHVDEIKKEFLKRYNELVEEKKEDYASENDGDLTGFEYYLPLKSKFDSLYNTYKERRNSYYKTLENKLKENLKVRLDIIEELKNIIDPEANIPDLFKQFNEIRERWKNAGPIPKDKYNHVWNNYHFHVENFYDYVHLDREARDMDFKHNLEQKQKVIIRAKELLEETDLTKVFRELQLLHKLWKEELGPVSREFRDQIWEEFSLVTRQIHDRREQFYQELRTQEQESLIRKQEIIAQIELLSKQGADSHSQWQKLIQKAEELREMFFAAGKVPIEKRDAIWEAFKEATRVFNAQKNQFYRNIKLEQQENLNRKQMLLDRAIALKDSEDFAKTTPQMKQIQEEWKSTGHVPRKLSDDIWKAFKEACNHYFDRLHAKRDEENASENEVYQKKKEYLEVLRNVSLTGVHKTDLDLIKSHIEVWKGLGRVGQNHKHVEIKYNKILDDLFDQLSLSKKEAQTLKYNNHLSSLIEEDDIQKINSERVFLNRKIEEVQNDIFQLENNKMFITGASDKNPFVVEVNRNIERQKQELQSWKDKLALLNSTLQKIQEKEENSDNKA